MNYIKKSQEWYERGLKEKDEFVKFLLFFIALEVSRKLEHSDIRSIQNSNPIKEKFFKNIDPLQFNELKMILDSKPLKNMQNEGDRRWSGKLESNDDFKGIIEFLVRARNNLFHGDKGLDEKRDEFIIKEGNKILEPLLISVLKI